MSIACSVEKLSVALPAFIRRFGAVVLCVFALTVSGCGEDGAEDTNPQDVGTPVSFVFAAQTGHTENSVEITLAFDGDSPDLITDDIAVTWVDPLLDEITVKGIARAEETPVTDNAKGYILTLDGVTTSGTVTVSVSREGYTFDPASKTVNISNDAEPIIPITFISAEQIGSVEDGVAQIKLVFDGYILGLGASDVAVTSGDMGLGAITVQDIVKAEEAGAYTLALDGVTAAGTVTVEPAKAGYTFDPVSRDVDIAMDSEPPLPVVNPNSPSIKIKFGITTPGTTGVTDTFNALHEFIDGDGLAALPDVIQLGDWIDLEGGITVEAYGGDDGVGGGYFNYAGTSYYTRLIVVGINSFETGKGSDGTYEYEGTATPHVVFQFQNIPIERRMNPTGTNAGGYAESEMRKYLVPVSDDADSGRFLTGLIDAGVPKDGVLWAPVRYVANGGLNATKADAIEDLLWLPTEREMFKNGRDDNGFGPCSSSYETAKNQARLKYYDSDSRRKKNFGNSGSIMWWDASPSSVVSGWFCVVGPFGYTANRNAGGAGGVAPAFCVR